MTGRRSVVSGLEGGRSKKKYRCQASGCCVTPRDLSQHYKSKTDWVVEELPELQAAKFEDVDLMLDGFSSFLKYRTKEKASMQVEDHEVFQSWFKVRGGMHF
jgi:hypothetical protein